MDRNMFKTEGGGLLEIVSVICMEKTLILGMTGNTGGFSPPSLPSSDANEDIQAHLW